MGETFTIDREAERARIERDVAALVPDPKLALRVFRGARKVCARQWQRSPNWVLAMELYVTGSTYAYVICRRLGIDPDARTAGSVFTDPPEPAPKTNPLGSIKE